MSNWTCNIDRARIWLRKGSPFYRGTRFLFVCFNLPLFHIYIKHTMWWSSSKGIIIHTFNALGFPYIKGITRKLVMFGRCQSTGDLKRSQRCVVLRPKSIIALNQIITQTPGKSINGAELCLCLCLYTFPPVCPMFVYTCREHGSAACNENPISPLYPTTCIARSSKRAFPFERSVFWQRLNCECYVLCAFPKSIYANVLIRLKCDAQCLYSSCIVNN